MPQSVFHDEEREGEEKFTKVISVGSEVKGKKEEEEEKTIRSSFNTNTITGAFVRQKVQMKQSILQVPDDMAVFSFLFY